MFFQFTYIPLRSGVKVIVLATSTNAGVWGDADTSTAPSLLPLTEQENREKETALVLPKPYSRIKKDCYSASMAKRKR